ncbi:MAG: hypothetical protein ACLTCQ_17460 [Enterocloster bolteae]
MIRFGKKSKILAAVLAAGIILSMQGMTAFAGSTGVGAAKPAQTGPGVAAQNDSQTGSGWRARQYSRRARTARRRDRQPRRKARQARPRARQLSRWARNRAHSRLRARNLSR